MPASTPRLVRLYSLRTVAITGPLSLIVFTAWLFNPDLLNLGMERGADVAYAIYQLLALTALASGVVAAVTHGQLATAKAFSAGYNAGLAVAEAAEDAQGVHLPPRSRPVPLRVVE